MSGSQHSHSDRSRAERREQQQAVVADLGLTALGVPVGEAAADALNLYRRALRAIGELSGYRFGLVLEQGYAPGALMVRAALLGGDFDCNVDTVAIAPGGALATVLASRAPVRLDAQGEQELPEEFVECAPTAAWIACPLRVADNVFGILVVCAEDGYELDGEDHAFLQAVANVLAASTDRQRARLRLSLEREVGVAAATADDIHSMFERVEEGFMNALGATSFEVWLPPTENSRGVLERVWPRGSSRELRPSRRQTPSAPRTVCQVVSHAGGAGTELTLTVPQGKEVLGRVVCRTAVPLAIDQDLLASLERATRTIGDFLRWSRMDEALRDNERRSREQSAELEAIYATLPVGLAMYDRSFRRLKVNQRLEELESASGMRIAPPNTALHRVFATARPIRDLELTTEGENGPRACLCSLSPLTGSDDEVVAVSAVFQDITEQKRTEHALRDADHQKNDFLALLGHELRNPLAAIRSAAELLQYSRGDAAGVDRIHSALDRRTKQMAKLIDGLLDVSRIIRGKLVLDKRVIDLCQLMREVTDDYSNLRAQQRIVVELDIPQGPLWVDADPVRLTQVFDNLLSNAAKFTNDGGRIGIGVRVDDERVFVQVEDTGSGIDPKLLPHIFEPFRQSEQRAEHSFDGLGLGLSLVKGLVELHGGAIEARSRGIGTGSTFTVALHLAAEPGPPATTPPPKVRGLDILIIEDNVDMAETLGELLSLRGHRVVGSAQDGQQGVALARTLRPHVVLCDLGLPGALDGFEVARTLRADAEAAATRLIAVTGYGGAEYSTRAHEAGFDACLVKPVSVDLLQRQLSVLSGLEVDPS